MRRAVSECQWCHERILVVRDTAYQPVLLDGFPSNAGVYYLGRSRDIGVGRGQLVAVLLTRQERAMMIHTRENLWTAHASTCRYRNHPATRSWGALTPDQLGAAISGG